MDNQASVSVELVGDKVLLRGSTRGLPPVDADYFPPLGEGRGYTGLELLLRRLGKTVTGLKVRAAGMRRSQHPTSFERIDLEFTLISPDAGPADLEKAVSLAEGSICPVWAMLKGNVEIAWKASVAAS